MERKACFGGSKRKKRYVPAGTVAEQVKAGRLAAATDFARVEHVDAVIICVPTPLNKNREPDISFIMRTGREIAPHLRRGTLIVLESTTYPGTTEDELRTVLERGSGLKDGEDCFRAFSPEREDPTNPASKAGEVPKLVGGLTPACLERAVWLYSQAIKTVLCLFLPAALQKPQSFWKTIRRSVNIALVNELKIIYTLDGNRHLGGHRSGKDKTVWIHGLLSRAWIGWTLYPD